MELDPLIKLNQYSKVTLWYVPRHYKTLLQIKRATLLQKYKILDIFNNAKYVVYDLK